MVENISVMNTIRLYYQSGNNFAFMLATSIISLMEHADNNIEYDIYIASADMSDDNKYKFESILKHYQEIKARITFIDASEYEKEIIDLGLPAHRGNNVTYYKIFVDRYFANTEVEHLMEIGTDTLVTGSLRGLLDFDFQGKPIAMNWSEKLYERRFRRDQRYCVAEMVYFNLPQWRELKCEERLLNRIRLYGDIYGSKDQGFLNMEFKDEFAQLPLKYNVYGNTFYFSDKNKKRFNNAPIVTMDEIKEAYLDPQIIHIPQTFLYRPNHINSLHPLNDMWWRYCRNEKNPWANFEALGEPELGSKEKLLRKVYELLPRDWADYLYIQFRHGYGLYNSIRFPYRDKYDKDKISQVYN